MRKLSFTILTILLTACASNRLVESDIDLVVTGKVIDSQKITLSLPPHGFTQTSMVHSFEVVGRASGYASKEYFSLGAEPYDTKGVTIKILDDRIRYDPDSHYSLDGSDSDPENCPNIQSNGDLFLVMLQRLEEDTTDEFEYLIRACTPITQPESYGFISDRER